MEPDAGGVYATSHNLSDLATWDQRANCILGSEKHKMVEKRAAIDRIATNARRNTITGAHWSGPRFFGLLAAGAERPSNGGRDG